MTKEEFMEWRSHSGTKRVFSEIERRIYELQTELGRSAGLDAREDSKKVGAIQAYIDLVTIDFEEIQIS